MRKKLRRIKKDSLCGYSLLMQVWKEAGENYDRLQSDAALARCLKARREVYEYLYGVGNAPPWPPKPRAVELKEAV